MVCPADHYIFALWFLSFYSALLHRAAIKKKIETTGQNINIMACPIPYRAA